MFATERQGYVDKLMSFNRRVGELETQLLQLAEPRETETRKLEVRRETESPTNRKSVECFNDWWSSGWGVSREIGLRIFFVCSFHPATRQNHLRLLYPEVNSVNPSGDSVPLSMSNLACVSLDIFVG